MNKAYGKILTLSWILTPTISFAEEVAKTVVDEIPTYDSWDAFYRMMTILGGIVAVMAASAWVLRKLMTTRMDQLNKVNTIKILERRVLSQKAVTYLLEVPGKRLVVGESPSGLQCLAVLAPEKVDESFEQVMNRKMDNAGD